MRNIHLNCEGTNRSNINLLCAIMIIFALCMLGLIIFTSYNIHLYSQKTYIATGKLVRIEAWNRDELAIYVDENRYLLYQSPYSSRSFGVLGNTKRAILRSTLEGKIGTECDLEYVKMDSNSNRIVQLTIDGVEFVNKEVALNDFIRSEKTVRCIVFVLFVLALICCIFARKGIIT